MLFWDIQQDKKKHTLIQEEGTPRDATHIYADARKKKNLKKTPPLPDPLETRGPAGWPKTLKKHIFFAVRGILVRKKGNGR